MIVEKVMEQAQVFASAWALVGSRFDDGTLIEDANEAQAELCEMVKSIVASKAHRVVSLDLLGAIAGALARSNNAPNTLANVRNLIAMESASEIELRHEGAWAQFCAGIGDSPEAPYPGMIGAFESHYGQSFADKDWRNEASVWAAAWKAALAKGDN